MYISSNSKRSSSNALGNILSSSTHFDQDQEEQSNVQKELNSTSLKKPDGPVSQTEVSDFGRIKNALAEEDNCSTSSSDVDNDDDTDDEYDE
jgi:hypothetical protein